MQGRSTFAILAMFLGSGCAALIYEVVWFHQLSLVLGATTISLAILLASFMGGLCLGSLLLPRLVSARHHPFKVYAILELFIGGYGLLMLGLLPTVEGIYVVFGQPGTADLPLRAIVAALLLLPPTAFMGATLPAISRWVSSSREGLAQLGWFYAVNTLGAVVGSLLAGLYLLPRFDVVIATCFAVAVNLAIAALAWRASERTANEPATEIPTVGRVHQSEWTVWIVIGLSGATALGAEAVWTRLLALLLGPTAYTFSIILAVFLLGLSLGSGMGAALARRLRQPGWALAVNQLLLMVAIPLCGAFIVHLLPRLLIQSPSVLQSWVRTAVDVVATLVGLLPCTLLWGASFPLAVAAAKHQANDNSLGVSRVYAANTIGAIVGALAISLIAIPIGGGHLAQQVLVGLSGIAAALMLMTFSRQTRSDIELQDSITRLPDRFVRSRSFASVALGIGVAAVLLTPRVPTGLLAWGRQVHLWETSREVHYVGEGLDSSIVVATSKEGNRCFHICGKVEASNSLDDRRTQRLLGHLPAMAHPQPKKALVIGCGSGMTAGALLLHPSIEEIVLCEMEPHVIRASRAWFAQENYGVLDNAKTRIVIDDARHFVATTNETFDIITTDPIHPWVRGAASLYTTEFYELCKQRLNPGGVVAQWVPLYESNEPAVRCEVATIVHCFPGTSLWSTQGRTIGYDVVALATKEGAAIDPLDLQHALRRNGALRQSLVELGLGADNSLQQAFVATTADLADWAQGAPLNRDTNLRLQYLAGRDHERSLALEIQQAMSRSRDLRHAASSRVLGN